MTRSTTQGAYDGRDSVAFRALEGTLRRLKSYHDHRVVGIDAVPTEGPALVVSNHSLATYDSMLLGVEIGDVIGRELLAMVDRLLFSIPATRAVFREIAIIGTRESAIEALSEDKLVLTMPGGMRESLRDRTRRYEIDWAGRYGFVKVAMLAGAPIVLAACPAADELFEVYPFGLTRLCYDRFHLPLPLFRGKGPTLIPRRVQLTHYLSEPLWADVAPDRVTPDDVEAFHARVTNRMAQLMHRNRPQ